MDLTKAVLVSMLDVVRVITSPAAALRLLMWVLYKLHDLLVVRVQDRFILVLRFEMLQKDVAEMCVESLSQLMLLHDSVHVLPLTRALGCCVAWQDSDRIRANLVI